MRQTPVLCRRLPDASVSQCSSASSSQMWGPGPCPGVCARAGMPLAGTGRELCMPRPPVYHLQVGRRPQPGCNLLVPTHGALVHRLPKLEAQHPESAIPLSWGQFFLPAAARRLSGIHPTNDGCFFLEPVLLRTASGQCSLSSDLTHCQRLTPGKLVSLLKTLHQGFSFEQRGGYPRAGARALARWVECGSFPEKQTGHSWSCRVCFVSLGVWRKSTCKSRWKDRERMG